MPDLRRRRLHGGNGLPGIGPRPPSAMSANLRQTWSRACSTESLIWRMRRIGRPGARGATHAELDHPVFPKFSFTIRFPAMMSAARSSAFVHSRSVMPIRSAARQQTFRPPSRSPFDPVAVHARVGQDEQALVVDAYASSICSWAFRPPLMSCGANQQRTPAPQISFDIDSPSSCQDAERNLRGWPTGRECCRILT